MTKILSVAYALFAYALFLMTVLYAVGFVGNIAVPKSIDSGPSAPVVDGREETALAEVLGCEEITHRRDRRERDPAGGRARRFHRGSRAQLLHGACVSAGLLESSRADCRTDHGRLAFRHPGANTQGVGRGGVNRPVQDVPSMNSTRTSASVIVASSPLIVRV